MENEWCTCFGVIKDHIKVQATETDDYIVSTDFLCGELITVPATALMFPRALVADDEVRLQYALDRVQRLENPEESDEAFIRIHSIQPITMEAVGTVTFQTDTTVTLDDEYVVDRDCLLGNRHITYNQYLKFEAVKCRNSKSPYRCLWAQPLTVAEKTSLIAPSEDKLRMLADAFAPRGIMRVQLKDVVLTSEVGDTAETTLTVKNLSTRTDTQLVRVSVVKDATSADRHFSTDTNGGVLVSKQSSLKITVRAMGTEPGIFDEYIVFEFKDYCVLRPIRLVVGDSDFVEKYTTPYEAPCIAVNCEELLAMLSLSEGKRPYLKRRGDMASGQPAKKPKMSYQWPIPYKMQKIITEPFWGPQLRLNFGEIFVPLNAKIYSTKLHYCLWLEEMETFRMHMQLGSQFRNFKLPLSDDSGVKDKNKTYTLRIENLAECKPSLMVNETICCVLSTQKNIKHHGYICEVLAEGVKVVMQPSFVPELEYNVQFLHNRRSFIAQHQAIEDIPNSERFAGLFPDHAPDPVEPILDVEITTHGQLMIRKNGQQTQLQLTRTDLDSSQRLVLRNILRGELRALPYLIRGPPGTGKTTTLIEIIAQLMSHDHDCKLLVCTQSNSAANLLLERCIKLGPIRKEELVRLVGYSAINHELVASNLSAYCRKLDDSEDADASSDAAVADDGPSAPKKRTHLSDRISGISVDELNLFRVVIVTCGLAGQLLKLGMPADQYTHLIIDETGQCLESETISPLLLMRNSRSQVIFAGDDKQLGPVITCNDLATTDFGESMFERLMKRAIYQENRVLSNQLSYNYRSVPTILDMFNGLFYDYQLRGMVQSGEKFDTLRKLQPLLPATDRSLGMGVFFYGVLGTNQKSKTSPSWLNGKEANVVVDLVKKLRGIEIAMADIGIITPYQGQVRYLKELFQTRGIYGADIGSVEQFQGQERPIIILSTVRSSENLLQYDKQFSLGFVNNPKRLNVAISRAQSLLIIVGNPHLLMLDPNWKKTVEYCTHRLAYSSCDEELLNLVEKIEAKSSGK